MVLPPLTSHGVYWEYAASQKISPSRGTGRVDLAGDSDEVDLETLGLVGRGK